MPETEYAACGSGQQKHDYIQRVKHSEPGICACGKPTKRLRSSGKFARFCSKGCCGAGVRKSVCPGCGIETTATRRRIGYCKTCSTSKAGKANLGKPCFGNRKPRVGGYMEGSYSKVSIVLCKWCGLPHIRRGRMNGAFCSRECAIRHASMVRTHVDKPVRCPNCHTLYNRIYNPNFSPGLLACSDRCQEQIERRNARSCGNSWKRIAAIRHSVRVFGHLAKFNPIDVLERDGWVCQACGVSTPKELRGTCESSAPEIDHIIPLSKGGAHVADNCQCLCRGCNHSKSDLVNAEFNNIIKDIRGKGVTVQP